MKKVLFFGLALIMCLAINATAQQWVSYSLPDGSPVLRLKSHGNRIAALGMRGLWLTENNGNSWYKIPSPFRDDGYTGVDFDETGNIYVSANELDNWFAIRTSDRGQTWQTIDSLSRGRAMDICLANGMITVVGGKGTGLTGYTSLVRTSSDNGQTWQSDSLGNSVLLQVTQHPVSSLPYIRTESGIWKGGSSASFFPAADLISSSFAISHNGEMTVIGRKATDPHDKRIYTSVNGGLNWLNTDVGYGDEGRFNDVAYTDEGIALVVGDDIGQQGRYGTVLMKKNGNGASWKSIFPDTVMTYFNAICTNSEYVFIGTQNGRILRSDKRLTAISSSQSQLVSQYSLAQNFPNPFNPATKIRFTIPKNSNVDLRVYDMTGKEIAILVNGFKSAGSYTVDFSGSDLSSGTYLYVLNCEGYTETKKMVLLK